MKVNVYTDGGARGNPGPAAYGFVVYEKDKKIFSKGEYIGVATNNVAEYTAVVKVLEFLLTQKYKEVNIYLDSLLIQKQMTGQYKIKNETMKSFADQIKEFEKSFSKVTYTHVPREKNTQADALVNQALDKQAGL